MTAATIPDDKGPIHDSSIAEPAAEMEYCYACGAPGRRIDFRKNFEWQVCDKNQIKTVLLKRFCFCYSKNQYEQQEVRSYASSSCRVKGLSSSQQED
jgi:hypothetical protein